MQVLQTCSVIALSGQFDIPYYLNTNPDVMESGIDPILHYALHGESEGRWPTRHFDPLKAKMVYPEGENFFTQYINYPDPYDDFARVKIPIIFAANDDFILYASTAIESLKISRKIKYDYEIFVLHTCENDELPYLLAGQSERHFIIRPIYIADRLNKILPNVYISGHITREAYTRLLIPDMFSKYEKVLYLDCDLISTTDISKLYDIDITGFALGAINDIFIQNEFYDNLKHSLPKDILENYFNSGVLLINNKYFHSHNLYEASIALANSGRNFLCHDQDVLNIVCGKMTKTLDASWNFRWQYYIMNQTSLMPRDKSILYEKAKNNPFIIHYSSWHKPLNTWDETYAPQFWENARRSPMFEHIKKKCACPIPAKYLGYNK